jgi:dTDP-4-dehydrorhamnose reductase
MSSPILVIGQSGQLARALARRSEDVVTVPRKDLDLSAPADVLTANLEALIKQHAACGVINAAAFTHVDLAETNRDLAFRVNADAPAVIAQVCAAHDIPFVHISTDYVFDGTAARPWQETDPTDPLNIYGDSKFAGEQGVQAEGGTAAILRTSWVYDLDGRNFVTTMLSLAETHDELRIVDDQIGRPTHADVLAEAAFAALGQNGIFHVSGTGEPVSWADFAKAIFDIAGQNVTVTPIPSSEYPTAAARPTYSVLDTSKFETRVSALPDWRVTLRDAFTQTG